MPLPDLIEIMPLTAPVRAEITVPGSKSITNRALVLAALAEGTVTLSGALWSEDTQVMVDGLQRLGFEVAVQPDPAEFCNRTITVKGQGGRIPNAGTEKEPMKLTVGNAGTAARFLAAMVCLGNGVYRLSGVSRMHERPQAALFAALRELGYRVDSERGDDHLPAVIHGSASRAGSSCAVSIEQSSQFASALLLSATAGGWQVAVTGENAEESPYVAMTTELIKVFPHRGGQFQIEPDASSGSYFWAADWVLWIQHGPNPETGRIVVEHWPESGWQVDAAYPKYRFLSQPISRRLHLGDSIMTHIVVSPLNRDPITSQFSFPDEKVKTTRVLSNPSVFTDLGRLRVQECERVLALCTELTKCGAKVIEEGDTLKVFQSRRLHGATIETYNDHRMAMCFAILGLKVPGIKIQNPACVKKTFPNFFQKLAAAPPDGLGVEIRDGRAGRKLEQHELFAD